MKGKREMKNKKGMTALVALVLILCCTVGGTLAWLVATTGPVKNTFTPGSVTTAVNEDFKGGVKSNVTVKNTGNVKAYIRAAIVVNWLDAEGNVFAEVPVKGKDYTLETGTGWTESDGYYYYKDAVEPGASTAGDAAALITNCQQLTTGPEGETCRLQVTILVDGIQAAGITGATNAQTAFDKAKQ